MVSIIIPTLNEELYLPNTLHSLKRQSFKKFEIIVVDEGSEDSTVKVAKKFGARVLLTKKSDLFFRNLGAKHSKGEIIVFTDADTIHPSNYLENIVKEFKKNKDVILVFGPGFPYKASLVLSVEYIIWNVLRGILTLLPKPFKRSMPPGYNMAFSRDAFSKLGGFNERLKLNEGEIGPRALGCGKVKFIPKIFTRISPRRYKKLGLFGFNRFYSYILGNIFYFLKNRNFYRRRLKRSQESFGR